MSWENPGPMATQCQKPAHRISRQHAPEPCDASHPRPEGRCSDRGLRGEQSHGQMDVPHNVKDVAWYRFGPSPGQAGSGALAAHVDLEGEGQGVFFRLRDLKAGDLIEVLYDDGSEPAFEVQARALYPKEELPLDLSSPRRGLRCSHSLRAAAASIQTSLATTATSSSTPGQPSTSRPLRSGDGVLLTLDHR